MAADLTTETADFISWVSKNYPEVTVKAAEVYEGEVFSATFSGVLSAKSVMDILDAYEGKLANEWEPDQAAVVIDLDVLRVPAEV